MSEDAPTERRPLRRIVLRDDGQHKKTIEVDGKRLDGMTKSVTLRVEAGKPTTAMLEVYAEEVVLEGMGFVEFRKVNEKPSEVVINFKADEEEIDGIVDRFACRLRDAFRSIFPESRS